MRYNLNGKGIFVFSDPAGANSVLTLIMQLKKAGLSDKDYLVFTDSRGVYNTDLNINVNVFDFNIQKSNDILLAFQPKYLFSATSSNNYEHKWRKLALSLSIRTIGFIDHWTNYYKRFIFNNEVVIPDEIWVLDKTAKKEAIIEGLPKEKILISGNPYYEFVKNFKPKVKKKQYLLNIGVNTQDLEKRIILFISDDIRRSFSKDTENISVLGYDEYTVLSDILNAFVNMEREKIINWSNFLFIIKLHPRSEISKFDKILKQLTPKGLNVFCIKDCDALTLNYYSDYVLGMFSNMVIESLLMDKKVLRVQTGQKTKDILKYGTSIQCITSIKELKVNMNNFIRE